MRIALFDDHRIGVLEGTTLRDVSAVGDARWRGTPYAINELIAGWDELRADVAAAAERAAPLPLSDVRLLPPLPRPRQLLAAPANYHDHIAEMTGSRYAPDSATMLHSPRKAGFFLKAAGSICGPADAIELPALPGRAFHHEVELGVVIGRETRAVSRERAREHVFGYLIALDITLRTEGEQQEERALRKSFESFTPIGPFIVTADEVADPADLDLRLWVNGELRQEANTRDLIVGVDELIEQASAVLTLHPGDLYATGTPQGVGPVEPGDRVRAQVQGLGELRLPVVRRDW